MKPNTPELRTLLATREFFSVDLYTITLSGGTILRYCAGDADISANGFTYSCGGQIGPYFDRQDNKATCHWKTGTESDTLVIDVIPGQAQVGGGYFMDAVRRGVFDGAEFMIERAYMPTYGDTRVGVVRMFVGRFAEIDGGGAVCTININDHKELLNLQFPRNLAQSKCLNNWGDTICGIVQNSYKTTGTVSGTPTQYGFDCSLVGSFATGTFDLGKVVFTSGALNGFSATVRSCAFGSPNHVVLMGFLPSAPTAGDAFTIYYGCNKSYSDSNGCPKFGGAPATRFRGQLFTPQPSTAV